jgi:hypothetical protein
VLGCDAPINGDLTGLGVVGVMEREGFGVSVLAGSVKTGFCGGCGIEGRAV